jgi:hypothetical protein
MIFISIPNDLRSSPPDSFPANRHFVPAGFARTSKLRSDGPRQLYLGWSDPARADGRGTFTVYLEPGTVSFGRKADQPMLIDMPGADTFAKHVAFRLSAPDGVTHAKAAARKVKR